MDDTPYTLPEEDPFSAQPPRLCMQPQRPLPRRRRSSLLDKWIHDQQTQQQGSSLQDLQHTRSKEDAITLSGYDFIEDDDIPRNGPLDPEHPLAPRPSTSWRSSKLIHATSPFRNFAISFRSSSTSISNQSESSSSHLSRFSLIPRHNRHAGDSVGAGIAGKSSTNFPRTSTISTISLDDPPSSRDTDFSPISTTSSRWRPSALEHFSSSSSTYLEPPDVISSKSRPSLSSNDTQTATTSDNSDFPITPTGTTKNYLFDHARPGSSSGSVFRRGPGFASSSSIWSSSQKYLAPSALASTPTLSIPYARRPPSTSPSNVPHALSQPILASRTPLAPKPTSSNHGTYTGLGSGGSLSDEEDCEDEDEDANDNTIRVPVPTRPHVAYSASKASLPRVKFSTLTHARQNKKKRKLVISGIAHGDTKKFEGIKKWCESFGEVNQIVRMPNGDLHVHFRLAEVAETVCRVKAKVTIAGVGSVQLSWYTGEKR